MSLLCLDAARNGEPGIACLRAPEEELRVVDAWAKAHAGPRRVVTITLRRYGYMQGRNSNLLAWVAFARGLDASRYCPVFVPDTNDTIEGLPKELRDFQVSPSHGKMFQEILRLIAKLRPQPPPALA